MHRNRTSSPDAGASVAEVLAGAALIAALAFGGGARGLGDVIVVLLTMPVQFLACIRWSWFRQSSLSRAVMVALVAVISWHALQLIPLPPEWVGQLPMRSGIAADLSGIGAESRWVPATLDFWGTVRSLTEMVAFAAFLALISTLTPAARLRLLKLTVLAGCAMALLGYAQAAAGSQSPLRMYSHHHPIGAVGTFANRNHFACLAAMLVPLSIALAECGRRAGRIEPMLWYSAAIMLLLAAGLSFSRTGFVLACAAAGVGLVWMSLRRKRAIVVTALLTLVAAGMISIYAWNGLSTRLQLDPLRDLRWQYLQYGWDTAKAYFPWGSGPGSFRYAYAPFEPLSKMGEAYALHSHNELVELAVEWGACGILFAMAAPILLIAAMRNKLIVANDRSPILIGSVVAVTVPMLHSLVDYPLRTYAVMAVFALASSIVLAGASDEAKVRA